MGIEEAKEPNPAIKTENPAEKTVEEDKKARTVGDFMDSLPPPAYKRFAPRLRRIFRLRLPFTFDYEYE